MRAFLEIMHFSKLKYWFLSLAQFACSRRLGYSAMELLQWRPLRFTSMRSILKLNCQQVMKYLLRMAYTEEEYSNRSIQFNLSTLWHAMKCFLLYWSSIGLLAVVYLQLLPSAGQVILQVAERVLGVRRYDIVGLSFLSMFVIIELFHWVSLAALRQYRYTKQEVVFEYMHTLDEQLRPSERDQLVRYFNRLSNLTGFLYKLAAMGIAAICLAMSAVAVHWYGANLIDFFSMFLVLLYSVLHYVSSVNSCCFLFLLTCHMMCLLSIFKLKMKNCTTMLRWAVSTDGYQTTWRQASLQYFQLLRQVRKYNRIVKLYILLLDYSFKFSTSFGIMFFIKQDKINFHCLVIAGIYGTAFFFSEYTQAKMTFFTTENIICFKLVNSLNARRLVKIAVKTKPAKKWCLVNTFYKSWQRLHFVETIGSNSLSFSYADNFVLTKWNMIQALMMNFYFMLLSSDFIKIN